MERILYLNERGSHITVMRDGPSLWIKERSSAGRRIPVRLICLVVAIENVRIDAQSIALLAENGIPLIIMDRAGQKKAVVIPHNNRVPKHYKDQKFILRFERNMERYKSWAQTRRMTIQLVSLKRLLKHRFFRYREIGEGNYEIVLKEIKGKLGIKEEQWLCVKEIVISLFKGLIIDRLLKAGLDIHLGVINRRQNFGLVLDLCHIVEGEIDLQAIQFFSGSTGDESRMEKLHGNWQVKSSYMHDIIHRFENRKSAIVQMVESMIDEFFELMREIRL